MLDMTEKRFTPAHANAALPLVRRIVADVTDLHRRLRDAAARYRARKAEPGATQETLNESRRELAEMTSQRNACAAELADLGIQLKDAERGLVDFPSEIDGERVLLCWHLGEPRVAYWHRENEGFAGRKPLPVPLSVGG